MDGTESKISSLSCGHEDIKETRTVSDETISSYCWNHGHGWVYTAFASGPNGRGAVYRIEESPGSTGQDAS